MLITLVSVGTFGVRDPVRKHLIDTSSEDGSGVQRRQFPMIKAVISTWVFQQQSRVEA